MVKPNIIIFNPDQMRQDSLGHFGNRAAITPNLDEFAREDAVSFKNAFCQNPVCVPSRCSFLTGLYPHVRGHRTMSYLLQKDETSLLKELKEAGYYVWMNARNDFLPAQINGIFEEHSTEIFYGGDVKAAPGNKQKNPRGAMNDKQFYSFYFGELELDDKGENYTIDDESVYKAIEKIRNRTDESPFCLFLGLQLPHPPYQIEEPYFSAVDKTRLAERVKAPDSWDGKPLILKKLSKGQHLWDYTEDDWDNLRSCYLGMTMKVDDYFGKVKQALIEEGIYDDTIIMVFSDHGDFTGDYGIVEKTQNTFEDCLVKVPLMIKPQKSIDINPGISESLVELIDVYATAMDLCDIIPSHTHFGISLKDVLKDKDKSVRSFVFSEGGRLRNEVHCDESNGNMPSPYNPYYPRKMAQKDDVAHTKATMIRSEEYKYVRRLYETDEFYDLKNDPKELKNEIDNPLYADIITDCRMQMLEWYQSTCDIVPYELDDRFNYDMIWNRAKMDCPKDMVDEVKRKIQQGMDLFSVINWVAKINSESNNTISNK